jgi:hypothetical protein
MKTEADVLLKSAIKYPYKGEQKEGLLVTVYAPKVDQAKPVNVLSDQVQYCLEKMNKLNAEKISNVVASSEETAPVEISGSDIFGLLKTYRADFDIMHKAFKEIACNGGCKVEGEFDMTPSVISELDLRDFNLIMSTYIAVFMMPSLEG